MTDRQQLAEAATLAMVEQYGRLLLNVMVEPAYGVKH